MGQRSTTGERQFLQNFSIEFDQQQYYGSYMYEHGVLSVGWNNATDYTRHQLSAISANPHEDAVKLLRQLLLAAKLRGEI